MFKLPPHSTPLRSTVLFAAVAAAGLGAPALARAQADGAITLDEVVRLTLRHNERALVAEAEAEAAHHRLARARAFFFPELTITGAFTRRLNQTVRTVGGSPVTISRHNALSAQANLVVPLFDARLFPLYRQAKLEGQSARLAAAEAKRLLGYEAADAFLMVLSQEQVTGAANQRLAFSRETLAQSRARAQAGLVSSNDVTRAELEVATAERELGTSRASAEIAKLELGFLVASKLEGRLSTPDGLLTEAGKTSLRQAELLERGLAARLDIQSGQARVLAAEAAADEPSRRLVPALAGVAQYRVTNEQGFSGRVGDGFAGLTATWPLWDGGDRAAESKERRALAKAEKAAQDTRIRSVVIQIKQALVALENARKTQTVAAQAAEIARRNVEETGELYRQGLVRALEVADANLRLYESEVALARERYALALAYLDLRAAVGESPPGTKENP